MINNVQIDLILQSVYQNFLLHFIYEILLVMYKDLVTLLQHMLRLRYILFFWTKNLRFTATILKQQLLIHQSCVPVVMILWYHT